MLSVRVNVFGFIEASEATRLFITTWTDDWNWKLVGKLIESTAPAGIGFAEVRLIESFVAEFNSSVPV